MKLTVTIDLDNDALQPDTQGAEVRQILEDVAERFDGQLWGYRCSLKDTNGNTVGHAEVTP